MFKAKSISKGPHVLLKNTAGRVQRLIKYVIDGGRPLDGEVTVSGAKNAAVALIPATLLVKGVCRIENIPQISDVTLLLNVLKRMGAAIHTVNSHTYDIDCSKVESCAVPFASRIRASYYLAGALLGRFGKGEVPMPGGCDLGERPIDQHFKGFRAMGADVSIRGGDIVATTNGRLRGAGVYLDVVSVGATINIMLAAALADGMTVIDNAAKEPHIVDVANFLNSMGANISGAGTDVIKIRGVERLHGGFYSIIPDQIEAGTYLAAVGAAGGRILVRNVIPKHLDSITAKLEEAGLSIREFDDSILIERTSRLRSIHIKTMPYPGFPTDMVPQLAALLCLADGTSYINEGIWSNRFRFADEYKRMGARIHVNGKIAVVEGVREMTGASLRACDLRAGAGMILAGLATRGITEIEDVHHIERGYENIVEKMRALGANIKRVVVPDKNELRGVV